METFNPQANMVMCRKYQQNLPKMPHPPFPTAKGQEIQDAVSNKAWQEWLNLQTMLINEKHLSLINPEAKSYLTEQRELFFNNGNFEQPTGWNPADS